MRFYEGKARYSNAEIGVFFIGLGVGVTLGLFTWGLTLLLFLLPCYCYYEYEKRQEMKMRLLAEGYQNTLNGILSKLQKYNDYDFYMVSQHREKLDNDFRALMTEMIKLPEKYKDLWAPIRAKILFSLDFIGNYNQRYFDIQQKRYPAFFDGTAFHDGKPFNEEQITAILTNEYINLIVAGPGAGKTRALTSRVAFFVHYKNIPQDRILVLAFNKTVAKEVRKRLQERFDIDRVDVSTFHSLGFRILRKAGKVTRATSVESNNKQVLGRIIENKLEEDMSFQNTYLTYLSEWNAEEKRRNIDESIVDEQLRYKLGESYIALDGTLVKSLAEREIANYFIGHGIEYNYEKVVDWCDKDNKNPEKMYCPDFYLPEYDVYLEHWGVTSDGETPDFFTTEESEKYLQDMKWKLAQFEKFEKTLWETNHTMFLNGNIAAELRKNLEAIEIFPKRISYNELLLKTGLDHNRSNVVRDSIINAICTAKIYGLTAEGLAKHVRNSDFRNKSDSDEAQFILDLVIEPYELYEEYLNREDKIDFEDMINHAIKALNETDVSCFQDYDMILVDEFQDISYQRLRLLQEIQQLNPDCRLFCVGDDWQAIYGFAGSSTHYMIHFDRWFSSPARVDLTQSYRNPPEILDFSTEVISECSEKLFKVLKPMSTQTDKQAPNPLVFKRIEAAREYDFRDKQNQEVLEIIDSILEEGEDPSEILVLSRFNFGYSDLKSACRNRQIPLSFVKDRNGVRFMTIHKSKGLEADYVILLNAFEGLFGFPPEITSKISFSLINRDLPDSMDEERRLLFVASTRAKKQCLVYTWKNRESAFLADNNHYKKHFPKHNSRFFYGNILHETDKAYKIEVDISPSLRPLVWVPKSVTKILEHGTGGKPSWFRVDEWWYEKEKHNFSA